MKQPDWSRAATRRDAYFRGMTAAFSVPVFVVLITFTAFGTLASETGLQLAHALFLSVTVFALPGQVVMVDQIAHGAGLFATAFAVTLTSVRLLPLTVSLMPYLRDGVTPKWAEYLFAHVLAITIWIESMQRIPQLPRNLRAPYYAGFITILFCAVMLATIGGFLLAGKVPATVSAVLIFLTPVYFFLSLIAVSRKASDGLAVLTGIILGPALFILLPGYDLFLTGLIGGSFVYYLDRKRRGL